jgi:hypothetical protein
MATKRAAVLICSMLYLVAPGCSHGDASPADGDSEHWLAGPDETSERPGDGTSALLFKISKADDKVRWLFEYEPESAKRIYQASRERWRTRLNSCQSSNCRYTFAREELNRLNFVLSRASMPIPGIPFRGGYFSNSDDRMSGTVHVIPTGDGFALVSVHTIMVDWSLATCEVMTYGRLPSRGPVRLKQVPDDYDPNRRAEIELVVHSDREINLDEVADTGNYEPICGVSAYITDKYVEGA